MVSDGFFIELPSYYMVPDGKGHWLSEGELIYYSKVSDTEIVVPSGKVNDLASIPWFFRRVFAVNGPHRPAAALHDYLYQTGGLKGYFSREECDDIFLEAMLTSKKAFWNTYPPYVKAALDLEGLKQLFDVGPHEPLVDSVTAKLMHLGVRIGGSPNFNKEK